MQGCVQVCCLSSFHFSVEPLDFCLVGISRNTADKIFQSSQFGKLSHQRGSKKCSQAAAAAQARSQQTEEEVARCFHMNHSDPRQHKYPRWLALSNTNATMIAVLLLALLLALLPHSGALPVPSGQHNQRLLAEVRSSPGRTFWGILGGVFCFVF